MIKLLKNKKGSALTYVLIIMMLLSILGLSLISSTVINFKINRQSGSFNKSFYITDGAIDESLAELKEITFRAEANASNWINDTDADFMEEVKWINFFNNINIKLESGELSSEKVVELTQTALEREFTKRYFQFLLEVPNVSSSEAEEIYVLEYELYDEDGDFVEDFVMELKNNVVLKDEYYTDLTEVSFAPQSSENFSSASVEKIELTQEINDEDFSLTLTSNGAYNESKKVIEVKLDVIVPNYNYVLSTTSKNLIIHKNDALTNALMARQDIIVLDGKATVNGNVYAYGTLPNIPEYSYNNMGGILVGADKTNLNSVFSSIGAIDFTDIGSDNIEGELQVDGDIATRSSIKINGNNSRLTSSGDMYTNTFIVDTDANDFIGSTDKNLYMMLDLLLFGDDSDMKIGKSGDDTTGELWTILSGSPSGTNKDVRNLSGSIIVNNNSTGLKLTTNKYFVSGVAYLDLFRKIRDPHDGLKYKEYYQTGESFTTNNNNSFYTKKIASTDQSTSLFNYKYASGPKTGDKVKVVESIKKVNDEKVIVEDVKYKSVHFITKNNEVIAGKASFPAISDRDKNIFTITSLEDTNYKNNYAIGVVLGNEKIYNPYDTGFDSATGPSTFVNMPVNDFETNHRKIVEKIDPKINVLATRNYNDGTNDDEKFDDFFELTSSNYLINTDDANNFIIIHSSDDVDEIRNIYINIPALMRSSIIADDPTALVVTSDSRMMNLTGAIITKGNIIIYNESTTDFVFNGPLISEKSILMYGSGTKTINNKSTDDIYSSHLVKSITINDRLYNATNSENGRKIEVQKKSGSSTLTRSIDADLDINIVNNSETINPTINSNVLLEGIIKTNTAKTIDIESWKEVD